MLFERPAFSIILPTYNRAALLARAVQSVFQQSLRPWELLIVDDGSTDSTPELLERLGRLDARIRLLRQENRGPAAARNRAIAIARAPLLAFLDSDDAYDATHLETRLRAHESAEKPDLVYSPMRILGSPWVPDRERPGLLVNLEAEGIPVTGTFTVRTEFARELGGFPNVGYSEDGIFFERAKERSSRVLRIEARTYLYHRSAADSICNRLAADTARLASRA